VQGESEFGGQGSEWSSCTVKGVDVGGPGADPGKFLKRVSEVCAFCINVYCQCFHCTIEGRKTQNFIDDSSGNVSVV
jgi:hypothetical protein